MVWTDAEVPESRKNMVPMYLLHQKKKVHGKKIKDCMHFWLLKVDLAIFVLTLLASIIPPVAFTAMKDYGLGPVLATILFLLTYLIAI